MLSGEDGLARRPRIPDRCVVRRLTFSPSALQMNPVEFEATVRRLYDTPEEYATETGVALTTVREWLSGRKTIPRRAVRQLEWELALAEQDDALDRSGLPVCGWVTEWSERPDPGNLDQHIAHAERLTEHCETCETCLARQRYVDEHLPPLPKPPVFGSARVIDFLGSSIERFPRLLRPAVVGALILIGIVSLRVAFALPFIFSSPEKLGEALVAVLAAGAAGACGGLAYSVTRPVLVRLGLVGDYLTGVVVVLGYMGSLALAAPYAFGEAIVEDGSGWIPFTVISIIFGLVMGHSWFAAETRARRSKSAA